MNKLERLMSAFVNARGGSHWIATVIVILFCLFQLSGCGLISSDGGGKQRYASSHDGPPRHDVDVSKIRDAVPRDEPLHPYGARNYVIYGKRYRVLKSHKGYVKIGTASWYGSKFHGYKTSTQEPFNLYGMTAASTELPLPCYVHVTNLRNGRKVVVRVNDRGPFHSNRILDLSYAAAKKLGFVERGIAPVKVVAIDPKTWGGIETETDKLNKKLDKSKFESEHKPEFKSEIKPEPKQKPTLFLQVGAFAQFANAKQLSERVGKIINKPVNIERKSDFYRVQVGPLASTNQRDNLALLLKEKGFDQVSVVEG